MWPTPPEDSPQRMTTSAPLMPGAESTSALLKAAEAALEAERHEHEHTRFRLGTVEARLSAAREELDRRLSEALVAKMRVEAELASARVELDNLRAERDEQYRALRDEVESRARELLLAQAENAKLRARLERAQAQCALPAVMPTSHANEEQA